MAGISARFSHETTIFTAIQPRLFQPMKSSKAQKIFFEKPFREQKKKSCKRRETTSTQKPVKAIPQNHQKQQLGTTKRNSKKASKRTRNRT
ncbi:hypothetical protein [Marichromatium gracile]|uniref:hypothetical protein n=1 Tax=Marichromatium gracile TaxID=1048 RepID=UPI001290635C|nr:hypothetical protein [Marichromatium gracile]